MAPVTMTDEVRVVLVEPDFPFWCNLFISATDALAQDSFACFILGDDISKPGALWSRILRVSVVIVKARSVAKDQIALDLLETKRTIFIQFIVGGLVGVLHQGLGS